MRKPICCLGPLVLLTMALLSGCGGYDTTAGGYPAPGAAAQPSAVSLSITDAPPAGMAVLSFQVTLNSAVLSPGGVDLLSGLGPVRFEVTRLATEIGFLNTASAPAGTYTSLQLTFADPELTFKNNTGSTLLSCPGVPAGEVCEFNASNLPGPLVSTISFPGTGLVIGSNSPLGLLVDLHLNTLLTDSLGLPGVNFGLAGAATAQRVELPNQPTGSFQRIDDLQGIVVSKDVANNRFTLQTAFRGRHEVRVNSDTRFRDFDGCAAANFTCLQQDQVVEVDLALIAGGVLFARSVELEERIIPRVDVAFDGVIYQVDSATQFRMVLVDLRRTIAGLLLGRRVTVTLQNAQFEVEGRGLTVPSALRTAFESALDTSQLRVGQHVQVRQVTGPPTSITADRVRLLMSRLNATVSSTPAPSGSNFLFNVNSLPGLFTGAGITQVGVQTSPETEFEGVNAATDLAVGRPVSLRGLLFAGPGPTSLTLIADKVRAR